MSRKLIRNRESIVSESTDCTISSAVFDSLKQYCLFLTSDKWDAEDLAQETVCKSLKYTDRYTELSGPLLKKIAYHLWIDHIRKQSREMLSDRAEMAETSDIAPDMLDEAVETLMTKLTPKQLVIFTLKEGFQYKISEIAELTDMSEAAVKGALFRSRTKLRKSADEKAPADADMYWSEQLKDAVSPAVRYSLSIQDPSRLIRLIPFAVTETCKPKLVFAGRKITYSSLQSPLATAA